MDGYGIGTCYPDSSSDLTSNLEQNLIVKSGKVWMWAEHASAVERSRLYDQDMIDKARRIKDQAIEMNTLENLLLEKTKEMSDQLSEINLKEKELQELAVAKE